MPYITQTDITNRISEEELVRLTTNSATATSVAATPVDEAIADAEGEIDSYIGKRYSVPLTDIPKVIVRHGVSIAVYYLYSSKGTGRGDENIKDNYDNAITFLKDVAAGRAVLQGASSNVELSKDSTYRPGYFSADDRVFSREKLNGF